MISFTQGNLLQADVEALVNTVNTVGIMGKGVALMFKDAFPANFAAYAKACKGGEVRIGKMFVTETKDMFGPKWIVNFPTKTHWRAKTKIEWIEEGLVDLIRVIEERSIRSVALPPLGCGNGGLNWRDVRPLIVEALGSINSLRVIVYEPTSRYQNVSKRRGVEKLTPARALVSEIVRRYCLLGIECSILEVQKLAWFIERGIRRARVEDPLKLNFSANKYGPYSDKLRHLLDSLDGSYLKCDKRLADADPLDLIWFNESKKDRVHAYLNSGECKKYVGALEWTSSVIDGFESPLGMELLATVDWLIERENAERSTRGVMAGLHNWTGGDESSRRKLKIFDERLISLALYQLEAANSASG
jgi:O-acetyl-ADP-ribose deacetylase (regulator of RNase III)